MFQKHACLGSLALENKRLARLLSCIALVFITCSACVGADEDTASDSHSIAPTANRNEPVQMNDDPLAAIDVTKPFLYVAGKDHLYNTYPCALPHTALQNTLAFQGADDRPSSVKAAMDRPGVRALMQPRYAHDTWLLPQVHNFIFIDGVNIKPLAALKDVAPQAGHHPRDSDYAFHFFGAPSADFGGLKEVLAAWGESWAYVRHLDIGLRFKVNDPKSAEAIDCLKGVLNLPACRHLETLSLRFMHLKDQELDDVRAVLVGNPPAPRKLNRLIFSFNELTDAALGPNGAITNMVGDLDLFPDLIYVDLRGNKLEGKNYGALGAAIRDRKDLGKVGQLMLGCNGLEETTLPREAINYTLDAQGFKSDQATKIRKCFAGAADDGLFKPIFPKWGCGYEIVADQILILRHGTPREITAVDLSDAEMEHHHYVAELLQHIPQPTHVKKLSLKKAFKAGVTVERHDKVCDVLKRFNGLEELNISQNMLGNVLLRYVNILVSPVEHAMPHLAVLNLSKCGVAGIPDCIGQIARGFYGKRRLGSLKHLDLSDNQLSQEHSASLREMLEAGAGEGNSLESLNLSGNVLTLADHVEWKRMWMKKLREANPFILLRLEGNDVPTDTFTAYETFCGQIIAFRPHQRWPLIVIDEKKADGTRGRICCGQPSRESVVYLLLTLLEGDRDAAAIKAEISPYMDKIPNHKLGKAAQTFFKLKGNRYFSKGIHSLYLVDFVNSVSCIPSDQFDSVLEEASLYEFQRGDMGPPAGVIDAIVSIPPAERLEVRKLVGLYHLDNYLSVIASIPVVDRDYVVKKVAAFPDSFKKVLEDFDDKTVKKVGRRKVVDNMVMLLRNPLSQHGYSSKSFAMLACYAQENQQYFMEKYERCTKDHRYSMEALLAAPFKEECQVDFQRSDNGEDKLLVFFRILNDPCAITEVRVLTIGFGEPREWVAGLCTHLSTFLKRSQTLERLSILIQRICEDGAVLLGEALKVNKTLTVLLIKGYEDGAIGDKGAKALAASMLKNNTLKELKLEQSAITNEGAEAFMDVLRNNTTLRVLSLYNNSIGEQARIKLEELARQKREFQLFL